MEIKDINLNGAKAIVKINKNGPIKVKNFKLFSNSSFNEKIDFIICITLYSLNLSFSKII